MGVLEDISAFSNPFGAPSKGEWNLSRGLYISSEGDFFAFFIEQRKGENKQAMTAMDQVSDGGGRRLAVYEYPYIDGQKIDDLGRKGETYTFNIKFHGSQYQQLLQQFEQIVVNDKGSGTLMHPALSATRGNLSVKLQSYEFVHRYDEFNAVTIKVVFAEDNTSAIALNQLEAPPVDSVLRQALQTLTDVQAFIGEGIFAVGALLLLPNQLMNSMKQRLDSVVGQVSRLIGQVSATFSPTSNTTSISAQAGSLNTPTTNLSSGTTTSGDVLPPVFSSGYNPTTQEFINSQTDSFINANQITVQQAVFNTNQSRTSISLAITEMEEIMGNDAYDMILQYRILAIALQEMTEVAISASRSKVKQYTVTRNMSLRQVAKENGLSPDRQNDIESLNPYLPSVNLVAAGSKILVPVS